MSKIKGMSTVFLRVSTTSGRKKLLPNDVKIPDNFNIQELARLGSKTVFNPKELRPFENARKEAQTYLTTVGIRFGGGYGVPDSRLAEVKVRMEMIEEKFNKAKQSLLANYSELLTEWLTQIEVINPELTETIKSNLISREYLESQIQFSFYTEEDESKLAGNTLINEVASYANEAIEQLARKKEKSSLNRKSLVALRNIKDKLDSMSFLNNSVGPTIKRIEGFLSSIPVTGKLGENWLHGLLKELSFLSEPSNFELLNVSANSEITSEEKKEVNSLNENFVDENSGYFPTESDELNHDIDSLQVIDIDSESSCENNLHDLDDDNVSKNGSLGWF